MTHPMFEKLEDAAFGGDCGPGIALRAVVAIGMSRYYPDDPDGLRNCVNWIVRQSSIAVLRTLRTPSASMIHAGQLVEGEGVKPVFTAMIDFILPEEKEQP